MLSVMIVDDEPKVREGLKTIIKWDDYGYFICGECADGIEGLAMMEKLRPDLVLVDIRMPEMDGLEFIEKAKQMGAVSKFIILTGYSDFVYTKKAIQLSVDAYLLKPVEEDELIENIICLREAIYNEMRVRNSINSARAYTRKSAVRALLKGDSKLIEANAYSEALRFEGVEMFQVVLVHIKDKSPAYNADAVMREAYPLLFGCDRDDSLMFEVDGRICIVLAGSDTDRSKRLLKELTAYLDSVKCSRVLAAMGRKVNGITDISRSYSDAVKLLENKFYFSDTGILEWDELRSDPVLSEEKAAEPGPEIDVAMSIERLYVAAELMNTKLIKELTAEICSVLKKKRYSELKIKGFCSNLLNAVYARAIEKYPAFAEKLPLDVERVTEIYDKPDIRQLEEYLTEQLGKLSRAISDADPQSVIKRIIGYINENYHQDLTLEMLGVLFGYNSCYLGKVIKQHTGDHFNTYLEKVRIEHAKQLLLKGYKVSDAAFRTGFKNIDYFYLKFKKNVGLSTTEFKKINCSGLNV